MRRTYVPPQSPGKLPRSYNASSIKCRLFPTNAARARNPLLAAAELLWDFFQIIGRSNVDDLVHLRRIAKQLLCASVQHPQLGVARNWEVKEQDVGHRQSAGILQAKTRQSEMARPFTL